MAVDLPKTRAFLWEKGRLKLLDQRLLPHKSFWMTCRTSQDVGKGIKDMVVRGAPAIGCVAAYGLVLAAREKKFATLSTLQTHLEKAAAELLRARPTAVNLRWALERFRSLWNAFQGSPAALVLRLEQEAREVEEQDRQSNQTMGNFGSNLIPERATLMTICNTGSLATAGLGTAFGVIWTAARQGKVKKVLACETRPYLQGARLTAWELQQEKIPFELITDSMAAHMMKTEKIDAVLTGADRIASNGDSANKIGTYNLAVLAAYHGVPFYIVAPRSTIDLKTADGAGIPIEERSAQEVTMWRGQPIAPIGIKARHPAFDVTPAQLITGIITEKGVARAPFTTSIQNFF